MSKTQPLPFLDTSVVRSLLMGTRPYRTFLRRELGERLYVGRFVDMEFKRGVLLTLIDFLHTLDMPHIRTIEDAEKIWSSRFKPRQVGLVLSLSASIFDKYNVDRTNPLDKERGMARLIVVIKSYDRAMRTRFKRPGDRTHCPCGAEPVRASGSPERAKQQLKAYVDRFQDVVANGRMCWMKKFFSYFRQDLSACVQHVEALPKRRKYDKLREIAAETKKVQDDPSICSCHTCTRLGDVVIAIGADRKMRLETTDQSFPHWCEPIDQPHRVHQSQQAYHNSLGADTPAS